MKNILIPLTIFIVIFISSCGGEEETSDVINCVDKYDCPETMQCIDGVCSDKCVDHIDTITVTPILVEYLRNGSYSATGMNNMKTFNFVITSVNE